MINSDYGVAMFDGGVFYRPYTAVEGDYGIDYVPIPLRVFRTIDLSRILRIVTLDDGQQIGVEPAGWEAFILRAMPRPDAS